MDLQKGTVYRGKDLIGFKLEAVLESHPNSRENSFLRITRSLNPKEGSFVLADGVREFVYGNPLEVTRFSLRQGQNIISTGYTMRFLGFRAHDDRRMLERLEDLLPLRKTRELPITAQYLDVSLQPFETENDGIALQLPRGWHFIDTIPEGMPRCLLNAEHLGMTPERVKSYESEKAMELKRQAEAMKGRFGRLRAIKGGKKDPKS